MIVRVQTIFGAVLSLVLALTLTACQTAKEDAFVDTNKRLKRVLSETLNVPVSRIVRTDTLANLGFTPGKNDKQVIQAIEREFKIDHVSEIARPNTRLYKLVDDISDYREMQAAATFGPVVPAAPSAVPSDAASPGTESAGTSSAAPSDVPEKTPSPAGPDGEQESPSATPPPAATGAP